MTRRARVWALVAGAVGLLVVGVLGGTQLSRGQTDPDANSAAVGFLRDMAVHHAQAVEMADVIRSRTDDAALALLATDITLTQQSQIGRMLGWLELWGVSPTVTGGPMAWMTNHSMDQPMTMPGMASRDDVATLADLPIREAEAQFLQLMIAHHRGGIEMAQAIVEIGAPEEVERLARSILAGQTSEIEAMENLAIDRAAG